MFKGVIYSRQFSINCTFLPFIQGDDGSPLIMKLYKDGDFKTYITGVTTGQLEDDNDVFIRFFRVRSLYSEIVTMVNNLISDREENVDCVRNSLRDLLNRPIKRHKTNTEE